MAQAYGGLELEGHPRHSFSDFKTVHGKSYRGADHERERRKIFEDNVKHIVAHNNRHMAGEKSYHLGVNQYADWTFLEKLMGKTSSER